MDAKISEQENIEKAGETAQRAKCSPSKPDDLSSVPTTRRGRREATLKSQSLISTCAQWHCHTQVTHMHTRITTTTK